MTPPPCTAQPDLWHSDEPHEQAQARATCATCPLRVTRDPVCVSVLHTCVLDGAPTDHEAPVEVREIGRVTLGLRYRGVRCDGSAIEWVERA